MAQLISNTKLTPSFQPFSRGLAQLATYLVLLDMYWTFCGLFQLKSTLVASFKSISSLFALEKRIMEGLEGGDVNEVKLSQTAVCNI